ncbi:hypothetical protein N7522_000343 [Penicillium canescens]|nr:hypothetical protein N7522_000343 [Penicillium canescens]
MENPSKTPEMTDTQGEVPLYTQQTSIEEPPLLGIATPLPILIIGPDTVRLSDRIFKSEDYYKGKPSHQTQLEVCIFAIPDNFEKSVEEIRRLRHCYHALSLFSRRERIEALITGEELLENNLIRQIKSIEPSPCKVSGEYLDVKVFDLFGSSTHRYLQPHLIGLEFAGMEFGIEWNVKDPMSKDDCWKARQGIPYIEAASSRDIKVAVKDRSRRRKPQSLVFHSEYPDWDPQTTVSIPISSV